LKNSSTTPLFDKSRRVFLTGGSRGIGLTIRNEFEKHGLEVICPNRDSLDLSQISSIESYLKRENALQADILVNNAGINFPGPIQNLETQNWLATMQVNMNAPFLLSRHFSTGMRERGWGRILNISSIFSLVTKEGRSAYSASKAAINGFTRTCAVEWGNDGVLVNALCPGYIDTDLTRQNNSPEQIEVIKKQIPLNRLADPLEITRMAVFLCSDMNSYMTGQCVVVDGGFTVR
jgi:3-oxoacyl-[acyl-carrier protein] reductase